MSKKAPERMGAPINAGDILKLRASHPIKATRIELLLSSPSLDWSLFKFSGDQAHIHGMSDEFRHVRSDSMYDHYTSNEGTDAFMDFEENIPAHNSSKVLNKLRVRLYLLILEHPSSHTSLGCSSSQKAY